MFIHAYPKSLIVTEQAKQFTGLKRLKDHPTDTAKNFRVDGHCGTVSFITSMTEHFCAGCNRLRLLADGNFKVCLFGPSEVNFLLVFYAFNLFWNMTRILFECIISCWYIAVANALWT
jgi:molybdenum cofactor biosynthesis enzyme MoaA